MKLAMKGTIGLTNGHLSQNICYLDTILYSTGTLRFVQTPFFMLNLGSNLHQVLMSTRKQVPPTSSLYNRDGIFHCRFFFGKVISIVYIFQKKGENTQRSKHCKSEKSVSAFRLLLLTVSSLRKHIRIKSSSLVSEFATLSCGNCMSTLAHLAFDINYQTTGGTLSHFEVKASMH